MFWGGYGEALKCFLSGWRRCKTIYHNNTIPVFGLNVSNVGKKGCIREDAYYKKHEAKDIIKILID
jgi:hypothetical protein